MQAGDAIGGESHGMTAVLEKVAEIGGDVLVVFDDEDAHDWTFLGSGAFDRRTSSKLQRRLRRPGGRGVPDLTILTILTILPEPSCAPVTCCTRRDALRADKQRPKRGATAPGPKGYCPDYRNLLRPGTDLVERQCCGTDRL